MAYVPSCGARDLMDFADFADSHGVLIADDFDAGCHATLHSLPPLDDDEVQEYIDLEGTGQRSHRLADLTMRLAGFRIRLYTPMDPDRSVRKVLGDFLDDVRSKASADPEVQGSLSVNHLGPNPLGLPEGKIALVHVRGGDAAVHARLWPLEGEPWEWDDKRLDEAKSIFADPFHGTQARIDAVRGGW
jgi:hypothetical protein